MVFFCKGSTQGRNLGMCSAMQMFIWRLIQATLLLLAITDTTWAGGSGLNIIVVVNQNSTNSVQLGNDYYLDSIGSAHTR